MKRIILLLLLIILSLGIFLYTERARWFSIPVASPLNLDKAVYKEESLSFADGLRLLKARKDDAAAVVFKNILSANPDSTDALWGEAETLRRKRKYGDAETRLNKILARNPKHTPALISLSYIRYHADRFKEAHSLIKEALSFAANKDDMALAYLMLGSINARCASKGWLLGKLKYGTQISCYLLKAKELAPDLAEVRMGLGSFYLLAPKIIGGNLDKAIEELNAAVALAPEFATANARLAQAYKKKGNLESYDFYLQRAKELDPENEVLIEESANQRNIS